MKHFKIKENYLLLKKWWETIDLTNYEKSFLNSEIISFNQQLLRLKEKKIRIGAYGKSGVGKSSVLNIFLFSKEFKTEDFPTPDLPYAPILNFFSLSLKSC
jgi:putative ribosome biogenesis GTPase RsgA